MSRSARKQGKPDASKIAPFRIWELPEDLLYQIACYSVPATQRARFLCQTLAPLCQSARKSILQEEKSAGLWDLVLAGDYGAGHTNGGTRRASKRLRRSPLDRVQNAHKLLKDNTEIAYYYLWELCYATTNKTGLTRSKLCGILNTYGPVLMMNRRMSSGGTFLVEVCRAKNTTQNNVLQCVQELVENRGAMIDVICHESVNSHLTALCVAAVRGMPKVVDYLLSKGASHTIKCSARFRLFIKKNKYLRCNNSPPLEFAQAMMAAEELEGATTEELRDLRRVVNLLSKKRTSAVKSSR